MHSKWTYILVMFAVTYLVRVLPLAIFRKPINSRFMQSFLYYVPYVTLALMTFPAIINATQSPIAGALALLAGIAAAWLGAGLLPVAAICCVVVFAAEFIV
jgi:branched-subunit amino acid transport protein